MGKGVSVTGGEGEEKVVKSRTKITEREEKHEQRLNYVMTCRRLCEPPTLEEVREAEGRVGGFHAAAIPRLHSPPPPPHALSTAEHFEAAQRP